MRDKPHCLLNNSRKKQEKVFNPCLRKRKVQKMTETKVYDCILEENRDFNDDDDDDTRGPGLRN